MSYPGSGPRESFAAHALMGARCLVLGGGGFIGVNLCARLVAEGAEVKGFGRSCSMPKAIDHRVEFFTGTLDDRVALSAALEGQDFVFHLISGSVPASSNRDPSAELLGGPLATLHLLEICRSAGVKKVVFASSGGTIYGIPRCVPVSEGAPTNPISAYGISKLIIEKYLFLYRYLHGLDYHALRISNPYGRYQLGHKKQGVVGAILHRALNDMPIEVWGTGEVTRDFIHVDDVVEAFLVAVAYTGEHRVMNVGSGVGMSINKVINDIGSALGGQNLKRVYKGSRSADVPINVLDTELIKAETGWRPRISWEVGLRETIEWVSAFERANGDSRP